MCSICTADQIIKTIEFKIRFINVKPYREVSVCQNLVMQ